MDCMKSERANKEKETVIKYEAPEGYEKLYFDDLRFFYASSRSDESFRGSSKEEPIIRKYGLESAFARCQELPIFDSCDREWGSYKKHFLINKGGKVQAVELTGGYKIGTLYIYEDVRYADSRTREIWKEIKPSGTPGRIMKAIYGISRKLLQKSTD